MSKDPDHTLRLPAEGLFPIRTVCAVTGVNPVTLRAWERRHNLLHPTRTPKGHRLYSREQIDRIARITELLDQGMSISQVKPLLETRDNPAALDAKPLATPQDPWNGYIERVFSAIERFDPAALDAVYTEAQSLHPVDELTHRLIVPVMERLGSCWKGSTDGIAQEHFLSAYLRNKIGARLHHLGVRGQGPTLVTACLPNEPHETGLLMFSLSALMQGYQVLYLGADMPLEQLPPVVERSEAAALVLSAHLRPRNGLLTERLPMLVESIRAPVFVGGPCSSAYAGRLQAAGAIPLGTDHADALRRIAETLRT